MEIVSKQNQLIKTEYYDWAIADQLEQARLLLKSGFLPGHIKTPEMVVAIWAKGREVGFLPMQSFSSIYLVDGKPCVSSEGMLALIFKNNPRAIVKYIESTPKICTLSASRDRLNFSKFSFSIEDAKYAGLMNKLNWQKYPAAMLRARCVTVMARALFPDAIMGISYTPEELGADYNENTGYIEPTSHRIAPEDPGEGNGNTEIEPGRYKFTKSSLSGWYADQLDLEDLQKYHTAHKDYSQKELEKYPWLPEVIKMIELELEKRGEGVESNDGSQNEHRKPVKSNKITQESGPLFDGESNSTTLVGLAGDGRRNNSDTTTVQNKTSARP